MIFPIPKLDVVELEVVRRTEGLRKKLSYMLSSPGRWHGLLRRNTFARAIRGSNTIEGYNVTVDDAIAAAEGEEPIDPKTEAWRAVTGYRRAMTYVLRLAEDPHFRYSADLLRALHFMMLEYDLSKSPGQWRPGYIAVRDEVSGRVVYEGPEADLVPDLMEELADLLNSPPDDTPGFILAALAHLNLVMIHPFKDGNGRMGRCLQTLVLARDGILSPHFSSIEEYLGRNTQEYYKALQSVGKGSWAPGSETHEWIRFILTAHFRQASTLSQRTEQMARRWIAIETETEKRGLPHRVIFALADASYGYRVRNTTYRTVAEIGLALASRDLKRLVEEGLLRAEGEGRGRYYIASPSLIELLADIPGPRSIEDPFKDPELYLPGLAPEE